MTPEQRRLRAELGAHALWARQTDRAAQTAKARRAFLAKLEAEVDPQGVLPAEERAFRAEHLRKAHMKRMALAASMARTAKARKKGGDEAVACQRARPGLTTPRPHRTADDSGANQNHHRDKPIASG